MRNKVYVNKMYFYAKDRYNVNVRTKNQPIYIIQKL